ncbi:MAG TPA: GntR family transcriptional regulator [Thermoanaerobaculia bacterium]
MRRNLTDDLAAELRRMIVDGSLAAGERLNEVHLAAQLDVSRTPLREALNRLANEGAIRSVPRIGWFVCALSVEEFEQIYPIRAILDPEALRLAGIPPRDRLDRLESLNAKILAARDVEKRIALDDAWHLELLAGCPNRVLIELIEQFMRRTHRYEIAYLREQQHVREAGDAHAAVLRALRGNHLERACKALEKNMQNAIEPIVEWLRSRGEG